MIQSEIRHAKSYLAWLLAARGQAAIAWYQSSPPPTLAQVAKTIGVTDSYLSRWLRSRGITGQRRHPTARP